MLVQCRIGGECGQIVGGCMIIGIITFQQRLCRMRPKLAELGYP